MAIGVIANADPVGELPANLCRIFRRAQAYEVLANEYGDGSSQRSLVSETSRKVWELTEVLTSAEVTALRAFYDDHRGPLIPFTYHDPYEAGITGQYTVRFDGVFTQTLGAGRLTGIAALRLIELA